MNKILLGLIFLIIAAAGMSCVCAANGDNVTVDSHPQLLVDQSTAAVDNQDFNSAAGAVDNQDLNSTSGAVDNQDFNSTSGAVDNQDLNSTVGVVDNTTSNNSTVTVTGNETGNNSTVTVTGNETGNNSAGNYSNQLFNRNGLNTTVTVKNDKPVIINTKGSSYTYDGGWNLEWTIKNFVRGKMLAGYVNKYGMFWGYSSYQFWEKYIEKNPNHTAQDDHYMAIFRSIMFADDWECKVPLFMVEVLKENSWDYAVKVVTRTLQMAPLYYCCWNKDTHHHYFDLNEQEVGELMRQIANGDHTPDMGPHALKYVAVLKYHLTKKSSSEFLNSVNYLLKKIFG